MTKIRMLLAAFVLTVAGPLCFGQTIDLEQLEALKPRNIGPAGMSGRITSIDVVIDQPDIIYAGAASGGLWKSESGGIHWEPVFDDQPVQSIGSIAINQANPDVVWVGTGEGNPRNSQNSGAGIFRSLDGGDTWERMGLENTKVIHRIIIHRDNPEVVYAAAMGSPWGPNPERGVYRTTDGGKNWEKILHINDTTGCADLVVDPSNPNKLIAAMWQHERKPWTFDSGGPGSGLYVTYDGGDTWQERTHEDGLPEGELGRIGLAIAASNPDIVYALVEAEENALYKSTNGGKTFRVVATKNIGNRPFYYADIFVDPKNENRIYNLYSLVSRSEDGGKTFETILPYSEGVHPDHHALWIHPENPDYIINGNDGGLYMSRDGGDNWYFAANLPVGQFYHVSYDMDIPYHVAGGMQDNGSWVGPAYVWQSGGIRNAHWEEVFFGDGFDVVFRPDDNRYVYAMSQGGNLGMVDRETGKTKFVRPTHPDTIPLRFNWNAAIAQDPFNTCGLYYGSQFVHYSADCGERWEIISPDLTTDDSTKQLQHLSGGLTIDDTQAENHTTILAIAPSAVDENIIWVGTDDGNLQLTQDGGESWTNLAGNLPGVKEGSWIPFIELSNRRRGEAFVVVNDYRRNDWRPMVFHTEDYGQRFRQIVDEEQVSGYVRAFAQDPEEPNLLFAGTDHGLYFSIDGGDNWTKWTKGFPSAPVSDLHIHPREQDLIIGTFGRSFWILDDIRPLREIAATNGQVLEQPFAAFDAPDAYLAEYRSYEGTRFSADAIFSGENRRYGAMLTVWNNPNGSSAEPMEAETDGEASEMEASSGKTPKKMKVYVLNADSDTIRTFSTEIDTGMNRVYWNMRREGVRYPSRREARPDADPPSGPEVLPGTYSLVMEYGDHKDSTEVTVFADPRLDLPMEAYRAKAEVYDNFMAVVEKATAGFDRLQEAGKTIKRVSEAMTNAPDSVRTAMQKHGKQLQKRIAELEKLYMMPEDVKGIQGDDSNLLSSIYGASRYLRSLDGAPTQPVQRKMEQMRTHTQRVLEAVNAFFESPFSDYRQKVEAAKFSMFPEYEPLRVE